MQRCIRGQMTVLRRLTREHCLDTGEDYDEFWRKVLDDDSDPVAGTEARVERTTMCVTCGQLAAACHCDE